MSEQTRARPVPLAAAVAPSSHIARMAAVGRLFGIKTAQPAKAKVLEVGCGVGFQLMASAQLFPNGSFVGIDTSEKHIESAQQIASATGLENVTFTQVSDWDDLPKGKFDYIVCKNLYSYLNEEQRGRLFKALEAKLEKNGLIFMGYHCLPGWSMHQSLRQMMQMHTNNLEAGQKVVQARALLKFLAESNQNDSPYQRYLTATLDGLKNIDDSVIEKEFLSDHNDAVFFKDFVVQAAQHKLGYVGDAEPASMLLDNLSASAKETLASLKLDLYTTEQYMDFIRNRGHRNSLMCHSEVKISREVTIDRIDDLQVKMRGSIDSISAEGDNAVFSLASGAKINLAGKPAVSLFSSLAKYGKRGVAAKVLVKEIAHQLHQNDASLDEAKLTQDLSSVLLQGYFRALVDFTYGETVVDAQQVQHPKALPLAKWQAERGLNLNTAFLDSLSADAFINKLLSLCDGSRDQEALLSELVGAVERSELQLHENNKPVSDKGRVKLVISRLLEPGIQQLAEQGLLAEV